MAATIINDEIRSTLYDLTKYPKFSNMGNDALTFKSLKRLLDGIVKTKAKVKPQTVERNKMLLFIHSTPLHALDHLCHLYCWELAVISILD